MVMRIRWMILALGAALAAPAWSQVIDAQEFLKGLKEKMYTNQDAGITDIQVRVTDSNLSMFPGVGETRVVAKFYWKPERGLKIILENLPDAASPVADQIRSYLEDQWLRRILVRPFAEEFAGFRLAIEKKGGQIHVQGTSTGDFTELNAESQTAVFDERLRPVSREVHIRGGGVVREKYDSSLVGEKVLLSKIAQEYEDVAGPDGTRGNFQASIDFEYDRVGGYSLPRRISATGMGKRRSVTFEEYKVNEGFDDAIYDQ